MEGGRQGGIGSERKGGSDRRNQGRRKGGRQGGIGSERKAGWKGGSKRRRQGRVEGAREGSRVGGSEGDLCGVDCNS